MITAQEETWSGIFEELTSSGVLDEHYEELSLHTGRHLLVPNYAVYFQKEAAGQMLVVTLRQDGLLVGYFLGFVGPGLHYQTCLTLTMDIFYIRQSSRNQGLGALRLFRRVESSAKARGVSLMYFGSKKHKDSGRLFRAIGMEHVEDWYGKFLEGTK